MNKNDLGRIALDIRTYRAEIAAAGRDERDAHRADAGGGTNLWMGT
jgi:hypothetical protein